MTSPEKWMELYRLAPKLQPRRCANSQRFDWNNGWKWIVRENSAPGGFAYPDEAEAMIRDQAMTWLVGTIDHDSFSFRIYIRRDIYEVEVIDSICPAAKKEGLEFKYIVGYGETLIDALYQACSMAIGVEQ